jgi:hypothetical protein
MREECFFRGETQGDLGFFSAFFNFFTCDGIIKSNLKIWNSSDSSLYPGFFRLTFGDPMRIPFSRFGSLALGIRSDSG